MNLTNPPDLLLAIVEATRAVVGARRRRESQNAVGRRAEGRRPDGRAFEGALRAKGRVNIVAECKRRSPSRGVLVEHYDPTEIALEYQRGGAAAISVLTEPMFFDGSLEHLTAVRERVTVPLLRKDFIIDEYQILEARAAGADAILLIVAALEQGELRSLLNMAAGEGMAALVEVHDEDEIDRALEAGAQIVGVNNRNIRTLAVDNEASFRLATRLPESISAVSESGLHTSEELERLRDVGYSAFLIGERLMTAARREATLSALVTSGVVPT